VDFPNNHSEAVSLSIVWSRSPAIQRLSGRFQRLVEEHIKTVHTHDQQ